MTSKFMSVGAVFRLTATIAVKQLQLAIYYTAMHEGNLLVIVVTRVFKNLKENDITVSHGSHELYLSLGHILSLALHNM